MPTAETVLSWATGVANDWRWLATAWHIALAALLIAVSRSLVSQRLLGFLLPLPIASVALLAAVSWNPFNAVMFTALTILLLRSATYLPMTPPVQDTKRWMLAGLPLVAFGWLYPHFLASDTWAAYAYASPFGLLPCPTLSVVIGLTLAVGGLRAGSWNGVLAAAGLLYGGIGVFGLGVALAVGVGLGVALRLGVAVAVGVGRSARRIQGRDRRVLPLAREAGAERTSGSVRVRVQSD